MTSGCLTPGRSIVTLEKKGLDGGIVSRKACASESRHFDTHDPTT